MDNHFCLGSDYSHRPDLKREDTKYVKNCKFYGVTKTGAGPHTYSQKCVECKSGFKIDEVGARCYETTTNPNCEVFIDEANTNNRGCLKCEPNYGIYLDG